MTPELMERGTAETFEQSQAMDIQVNRGRGCLWPVVEPGQLDVRSRFDFVYLDDIEVSFDGFKALNKLSLDIAVGEMRCIIGPNGAGKTTMMDVITGKTRPDKGSAFSAPPLTVERESDIAQIGIGRKFQSPQCLNTQRVRKPGAGPEGRSPARASVFFKAQRRTAGPHWRHAATDSPEVTGRSARRACCCRTVRKQWLEIGMLLMQDPKAVAAG